MAKASSQKPNRRFWTIFGVAAVVMLGYFYMGGDDSSTAHTVTAKKKTVTSSGGSQEYLPEDSTATFPRVNFALKNTFKPLISKGMGNGIDAVWRPTAQGNWAYTGDAVVNGQITGLLEDSSSGDSVFLKTGDTWKGLTVLTINSDEIVLRGTDGVVHTMKLGGEPDKVTGGAGAAANGLNPVRPPLSGAIGGISIQPDQGANPAGAATRGGRRNRRFGGGQPGGAPTPAAPTPAAPAPAQPAPAQAQGGPGGPPDGGFGPGGPGGFGPGGPGGPPGGGPDGPGGPR